MLFTAANLAPWLRAAKEAEGSGHCQFFVFVRAELRRPRSDARSGVDEELFELCCQPCPARGPHALDNVVLKPRFFW